MNRSRKNAFRRWQFVTVLLLATGYAGYYLCRSDLSVVMPLLIEESARKGVDPGLAKVRLGGIAAAGVLAYAIGKFPSGWAADFFGGKRNFLGGMLGSVFFTAVFAASGGFPLFTVAWIGNRLVQSLGWAGIVKVVSKWFSFSNYGSVMALVSLSYLFGDALSREVLGLLIGFGLSWRQVFSIAALTLSLLLLISTIRLKETPREMGYPEPPANPLNLFQDDEQKRRPDSLRMLLSTFAKSQGFWIACALSAGITLVRETFNLWTPTFFVESVGLSTANAAQMSALFPFFGGISVLLAGFASDRLGRNGRAWIIFAGLLVTAGLLLALAFNSGTRYRSIPVILVAAIALLMIGPYSYLAGAISLDLGGKRGSATASGFIDGVGYLGGVLAGNTMASISVLWGWQGAFLVLAVVTLMSTATAAIFLVQQRRMA